MTNQEWTNDYRLLNNSKLRCSVKPWGSAYSLIFVFNWKIFHYDIRQKMRIHEFFWCDTFFYFLLFRFSVWSYNLHHMTSALQHVPDSRNVKRVGVFKALTVGLQLVCLFWIYDFKWCNKLPWWKFAHWNLPTYYGMTSKGGFIGAFQYLCLIFRLTLYSFCCFTNCWSVGNFMFWSSKYCSPVE